MEHCNALWPLRGDSSVAVGLFDAPGQLGNNLFEVASAVVLAASHALPLLLTPSVERKLALFPCARTSLDRGGARRRAALKPRANVLLDACAHWQPLAQEPVQRVVPLLVSWWIAGRYLRWAVALDAGETIEARRGRKNGGGCCTLCH